MKFKYKKGFEHQDCHKVEERIRDFIDRKVRKGFYSKKVGHYTNNLHKEYTVSVIIKEKK